MADLKRLAASVDIPPEERQRRWQCAVRSRLHDHEKQISKARHAEMQALRARTVKQYRELRKAATGTPEHAKAAAMVERAEQKMEHVKLQRAQRATENDRLRAWYKGPRGARDLFDTVPGYS
eukprot:7173025-Prymnesium_polylepis.1